MTGEVLQYPWKDTTTLGRGHFSELEPGTLNIQAVQH